MNAGEAWIDLAYLKWDFIKFIGLGSWHKGLAMTNLCLGWQNVHRKDSQKLLVFPILKQIGWDLQQIY